MKVVISPDELKKIIRNEIENKFKRVLDKHSFVLGDVDVSFNINPIVYEDESEGKEIEAVIEIGGD